MGLLDGKVAIVTGAVRGIGGEAVSGDIWLRKYWSFTPEYYSWTYTLTVTDKLLAELSTE